MSGMAAAARRLALQDQPEAAFQGQPEAAFQGQPEAGEHFSAIDFIASFS